MNDKIKKAIESFSSHKILVIGDIMLDHYIYGDVSRISPEAPVPILKKVSEEYVPGGAANVANNIHTMGGKVSLAGFVGNDYPFQILKKLLKKTQINTQALIVLNNRPTIIKERFVARDQHMLRLDTEETLNLTIKEEKKLLNLIKQQIHTCDGIILSDYAKGCFSKKFTENIIQFSKQAKKPVLADIKPQNKDFFKGVNSITPNLKEALEMTGEKNIYQAGGKLRDYYRCNIIITKGKDGISIFKKNGESQDIPTKKVTALDVSGAGDTAIAAQALGVVSGLSIEDAAQVANAAGTIVVQKLGTATISAEELMSAMDEEHHIEAVGTVPKVWGYEKWLENNPRYCCKLLSLNKGYQCSLHYHKEKDEMFFVTKGHVRLESDEKVTHMRAGNFQRIRPGTKHRFSGIEDSVIIEVSSFHLEEDSYRLEKSKKVEEIKKTRARKKSKTNGHRKNHRITA